jgi:hypothetical protein
MMRWITGLVVVVLAVVIVPAAISQMESTQRVYTYVGQSKFRGRIGRHTLKIPTRRLFPLQKRR